jgi:hypothetical protein
MSTAPTAVDNVGAVLPTHETFDGHVAVKLPPVP